MNMLCPSLAQANNVRGSMERSGQGEVVWCGVCSMEGGRSHLLHRDRHGDDGAAACGVELETKAI